MHAALMAATLLTAACAAYFDIRRRRIFNWLTLGAAGAALAIRLAASGMTALLNGAEGWLVGIGLLLIPFALGVMGGGDVKLLAAFGALGGPLFVEQTAIIGAFIGGLLAISCLVWQRRLWFTLRHFIILIKHPVLDGTARKEALPFGALLSAGAVASLVFAGALG
jgi:prepilin peptidase CpaA